MEQGGDRLAVVLEHGHGPARSRLRQSKCAALSIDVRAQVGQPVADLKGRIAERLGQLPDSAGTGLADLDNKVSDRRTPPRAASSPASRPRR